MKVQIYGASDDLIEVDGDISAEFPLDDDGEDGDLLAFSDGTILRIAYTGLWRITPVVRGTARLTVDQWADGDEGYSDKATLDGDFAWVVHGIVHAKAGA